MSISINCVQLWNALRSIYFSQTELLCCKQNRGDTADKNYVGTVDRNFFTLPVYWRDTTQGQVPRSASSPFTTYALPFPIQGL